MMISLTTNEDSGEGKKSPTMRTILRIFQPAILLGLLATGAAFAGGGPERTLLVVNADSGNSLRVAGAYVRLRKIPSNHVFYLHGVPKLDILGVDAFRDRIWGPIRGYMEKEALTDVIDIIVYSVDFPYAIDFRQDLVAAGVPGEKQRLASGSLTGLTYLAHRVETKDPVYRSLWINEYYRRTKPGVHPVSRKQQALHATAMKAVRAGEYRPAVQAFKKLFETYGGDWKTWLAFARALGEAGREDDAFHALREAVRRGFSDFKALDRVAVLKALTAREAFANLEAEGKIAARGVPAGLGFRPGRAGTVHRYYLCTCLGYTGVRGNSIPEVLAMLQRAAAVDGTCPEGTVYFMKNSDIRSRTREPAFEAAVRALETLGRKGEILARGKDRQTGKLPVGKDDVMGLVAGSASFNWPASGSRILPGAICEHLTSFGAYFRTAGQTKASEFLRHGAAGTSGTVVEPYALQMKFPHPFIHVYYAEGCSLAEAFYQSVWGPYQLLVMGDPLARPYARFAGVTLAAPSPAAPWKESVQVVPAVKPVSGRPIAGVEVWVDGRCIGTAMPGKSIPFDTRTVADGHHEVRLVAVEATRIETRSSWLGWCRVDNAGRVLKARVRPGAVVLGTAVKFSGRAPKAGRVEVFQGARVLAAKDVRGGSWTLDVPSERLGVGQTPVQVRAVYASGPAVVSPPLQVTVAPPKCLAGRTTKGLTLGGLRCRVRASGGRTTEVLLSTLDDTRGRSVQRDLKRAGIRKGERLTLEGEFRVKTEGLHHLILNASGILDLEVDGCVVCKAGKVSVQEQRFFPVALRAGWHALKVDLEVAGPPHLVLHLGGEDVTVPLQGNNIRHPAGSMAAVRKSPEAVVRNGKKAGVLVDGKRRGASLLVPGDGVTLTWKRPERKVLAVVVYPPPGKKKSPAWPRNWTVEWRGGSGPWRKVKNPETTVLRPPARRPGKHEIPQYLKVSFRPVTARALRLRPVAKKDEKAHLVEIEVYRRK